MAGCIAHAERHASWPGYHTACGGFETAGSKTRLPYFCTYYLSYTSVPHSSAMGSPRYEKSFVGSTILMAECIAYAERHASWPGYRTACGGFETAGSKTRLPYFCTYYLSYTSVPHSSTIGSPRYEKSFVGSTILMAGCIAHAERHASWPGYRTACGGFETAGSKTRLPYSVFGLSPWM
jgi:hypothetical protein